MPENENPNEQESESHQDEESDVVKTLRSRGDKAEERAAALERKLAFMEAGLDESKPMVKFFAENYKGDMTAEAVVAAAAEVGLVESPDDETKGPTPEQQQAQDDREALTGGTQPDSEEPDPNPIEVGMEEYNKARQRGVPSDVAAGQLFDRMIDAASKGDPRVVYDEEAWKQQFADMGYTT